MLIKNLSKDLTSYYNQKLLDHAKPSATDTLSKLSKDDLIRIALNMQTTQNSKLKNKLSELRKN